MDYCKFIAVESVNCLELRTSSMTDLSSDCSNFIWTYNDFPDFAEEMNQTLAVAFHFMSAFLAK